MANGDFAMYTRTVVICTTKAWCWFPIPISRVRLNIWDRLVAIYKDVIWGLDWSQFWGKGRSEKFHLGTTEKLSINLVIPVCAVWPIISDRSVAILTYVIWERGRPPVLGLVELQARFCFTGMITMNFPIAFCRVRLAIFRIVQFGRRQASSFAGRGGNGRRYKFVLGTIGKLDPKLLFWVAVVFIPWPTVSELLHQNDGKLHLQRHGSFLFKIKGWRAKHSDKFRY
jgi:hypothetical protein